MLKALLFDVDGTLAETEEGHREAWNASFVEHGLDWHWDRTLYRELLQIAGGRERLAHYADGALDEETMLSIHRAKNRLYRQAATEGAIPLRPGVGELVAAARQRDLTLAIVTTTSRANVEALINGTLGSDALSWFSVWACAEDAQEKKPDPTVYRVALDRLDLAPDETVAFEDSRNGLLAAHGAGIPVVFSASFYMDADCADEAHLTLGHLGEMNAEDLLDRLGSPPD